MKWSWSSSWVLAGALCLAFAAQAQTYKWRDENGKIRYGDTPPPGVKAVPLSAPPPLAGEAPAAPAAKDGKGRPLTPKEQELELRKRAKDRQDAETKATQARQDAEDRQADCNAAKDSMRQLESGQRISRTNANGERYYLEDAQIQQEKNRARQAISQACR